MNLEALRSKCVSAINSSVAGGRVSLIIPGRAHGNTKRLPGLGIRGEVVCEYDGCCLCAFDAKKILTALDELLKEDVR